MTEPIDPFGAQAAAPAPAPEEAQQQTPATPPSDPWAAAPAPAAPPHTIVQGADGKVVLTFKGGTSFSEPWVVIHASNLDEALSYVTEHGAKLLDLFTRVRRAADSFNGGSSSAAPSSGGAERQAAPVGAAGPPPGSPAMPAGYTYVTKVKNGRPWHGYFPSDAQKAAGEKAIFFDPPK